MIGQGVPEAKSHLHSALIDSWPKTMRGDASPRTAMFGSTTAIRTTSETLLKIRGVSETEQVMFFTRVAPRTKSKGLPIGGPLHSKKYVFYTRSTAYKKQGASNRRSLTQQKIILFTCVVLHTKINGLPIGGPLLSKNLCFYMYSSAYKKQEAPDRRSLTQQKCMLFTCIAPRIKSKRLHRYVL
jgi:hypothetical protein